MARIEMGSENDPYFISFIIQRAFVEFDFE